MRDSLLVSFALLLLVSVAIEARAGEVLYRLPSGEIGAITLGDKTAADMASAAPFCASCASCPAEVDGGFCQGQQDGSFDFVPYCLRLGCEVAVVVADPPCGDPNQTAIVNELLGEIDPNTDLQNFPPPWPGCPTTEAGLCADRINNDAWLDDLTDCADPDCFTDPACPAPAPALSALGLGALAALLIGIGGLSVVRRRRS